MNLADLAALGTLVSSLAVVITLLFLVHQLRQTSRNQKSLMQQGRTARYVQIISARTEPHLGEAFSRALHNQPLDDVQWAAISSHIDAYFWHFEDCFLQFEAGTIDQASWESDQATMAFLFALPTFRAQWKTVRVLSSGAYRDHVDALMQETPVIRRGDYRDAWNANLAEAVAPREV